MRRRRRSAAGLLPFAAALCLAAPAGAQDADSTAPADAEFGELAPILEFLRDRNARDYAISSPTGIDTAEYVEIGGIPQWISIRGEDRSNPVLLFLHGGPGDATNLYGYAIFRSWLRDFTVVQWDQRGAGRTLGRNGPGSASAVTVDRMVQDGIELAEYLRGSLGKEKILLVGHSWGSILGAFMAKARPDLFLAFVGTGQVADPAQGYAVAHRELLAKAEALGNRAAIEELREIGPPPYADGWGYQVQRKWANRFEGADRFLPSTFGLALTAPGYTLGDVNDWLAGQGVSAERLVPETSTIPASTLAGVFALPVFVIQGAEDFTTPTSLAEAYVESIEAPWKEFVRVEGGHFAVFMEPEAFRKELVERVLPRISETGE